MESCQGSTVLKGQMTEENDLLYGTLWTGIRAHPLSWLVYNGLMCSIWLHLAEKCIEWLNSTLFLKGTTHQVWQRIRPGENCKDSYSTGDLELVVKPSELTKCNNRKAVGEKWCSKLMGGCQEGPQIWVLVLGPPQSSWDSGVNTPAGQVSPQICTGQSCGLMNP